MTAHPRDPIGCSSWAIPRQQARLQGSAGSTASDAPPANQQASSILSPTAARTCQLSAPGPKYLLVSRPSYFHYSLLPPVTASRARHCEPPCNLMEPTPRSAPAAWYRAVPAYPPHAGPHGVTATAGLNVIETSTCMVEASVVPLSPLATSTQRGCIHLPFCLIWRGALQDTTPGGPAKYCSLDFRTLVLHVLSKAPSLACGA